MGFKRKRISKTKPVRSADSDEEAEIDFIQNIYDEDSNLYYISKKLNKAGVNLEDELECEKNPRILKQTNLRALLPIKKDGKIIPIFDAKPKVVYADDLPTPVLKKKTEKQPIQNFENLEEFKIYLSRVSNQILSNPEQNIHSIAKLIRYLQCKNRPFIMSQDNSSHSQDVSTQKGIILIIASLTEIFRDIIPGYKIRKATEQEKDQMAKKETRELRKFEELLLNYYGKFFAITKRFATQKKYRTAKTIQTSMLIIARSQLIIQSWGELVRCKPHFNCNKEIIHALIPNLNHKVEKIREVAMDVIKGILLKGDTGHSNNVSLSLEIVQAINQYLRAKKFRAVRPDVLDALLWLRIDDINAHIAAQMSQFKESELKARKLKKVDAKGKRDKFSKKKVVSATNKKMSTGDAAKKFLSRKQFKKSKALEQFKREVDTLGNAVSLNYNKHKNDATICNTIFTIYFKILRSFHQTYHNNDLNDDNTVNDNKRLCGKSIALLSAALRGLAQFARLINIEMFHDLIDTLYQISINKELKIRDRLNAIYTTFVILRGGQHQYTAAFNIDMNRFYQSLYSLLFNSQTGPANATTKFTITDLTAFAKCLDICFIKGSSSTTSSLNNNSKTGHRTMPKYSAETLVARLLKPDERLQMIRVSAFIQRLCYVVENLTEFCTIPSTAKCATYNMTCNAGNLEGSKSTSEGKEDANIKLISNACDLFQSILFTLMAKLLQAFPTCLHLLSNNLETTSKTNKLRNQIELLSAFEFTANQSFALGLDHHQVINGVKWIHNIILNVCSQKPENVIMPKNICELSSTRNILEVFLMKGLTPWMYKTIDTLQKMEMTENGLPLSSVQSQTTNNSYQRIVQNFNANTYSHCLEKAYKVLIHSQTTGTTIKWQPRDFWKPFLAFNEATPQNSKFHKKQKSLIYQHDLNN